MQVYEVLSECTVAMTYYNTTSWHYEEIKSSVAWFSPIKLHNPTIAIDPTHCAWAHDMWIRPIQVEEVEVTLYFGQTDPGSWDVQSAYARAHCWLAHCWLAHQARWHTHYHTHTHTPTHTRTPTHAHTYTHAHLHSRLMVMLINQSLRASKRLLKKLKSDGYLLASLKHPGERTAAGGE